MNGQVLSVRQVTDRIKLLLEQQFPYVWVQGEVTNLTRPASGHVYFSLKDGESLLACVWFRGRQRAQESVDPLTGEVFDEPRPCLSATLRNGQQLVCAGQVTVHAPRGSYQLRVDYAQASGEGLLHLAFEELKRSLLAEGLFDGARKRPLPDAVTRVALVTSPTGAAIQDFVRVASERGCGAELRIYPALVQGDDAPEQLVRALRAAQDDSWPEGRTADVIVLIRGGGSLQDLWAFNDADLARAVFSSSIPVLTGIGHEIDTSIADLTADARAATPSHAAQILWPDRDWYAQRVDDLETAMLAAFNRASRRMEDRLTELTRALQWLSPARHLERLQEQAGYLAERLDRMGEAMFGREATHLSQLRQQLDASALSLLENRAAALRQFDMRMRNAGERAFEQPLRGFELLEARMLRYDPLAPLERGYAIVKSPSGAVVRSVDGLALGDAASVQLRDGSLAVTVETIRKTT